MAYVLTSQKPEAGSEEKASPRPYPPTPTRSAPAQDESPGQWNLRPWIAKIEILVNRCTRLLQRPLPPKELILFTSQLSIMTATGTALISSLEALEAQTTHSRLRRALGEVIADIKSGQMLSTAMGRHLDVFPETIVSMMAIGESGGFLDQMLDRMSTILGKQAELRSTVRSAFTYPLVLALFCVLVVGFMMAFILPRFISIFEDMEAVLPLPTRVLLGSVDFLKYNWMFVLPAVVATAAGLIVLFSSTPGRRFLDRWILSIPVVGSFIRNVVVARLMRSVGEMLDAGVPLLEALQVSKPILGNVLFRDMIERVEGSIISGKTLSGPIGESGLVPPTVQQMLQTGESTGALAITMIKIADFYDARSKAQAKDLTTILEPTMIFVVGGIVGFVVISLLLPVFKMSSVMH
ncbi:MAG: type II secretion system F family protein [Candidatus Eisenbacteria sp.]|nr:type II secretion system F family protein [Candidatus Eisenbacteria bacterium]